MLPKAPFRYGHQKCTAVGLRETAALPPRFHQHYRPPLWAKRTLGDAAYTPYGVGPE